MAVLWCRADLVEFLPKPHVVKTDTGFDLDLPETTAEYNLNNMHVGQFMGQLPCVFARLYYILTLGKENLKMVGPYATLNANYIKECLKDDYELPIEGICMHEFVFDGLKDKSTGVTTMDVAKRLLDYGYHAPTIYFPLLFHEAMMIEPTENESKKTLDGFINIMHTNRT